VDSKSENKNQEYLGVRIDDKKSNQLDQPLKPAQKIDVQAVMRVSGNAECPKLMAARYEAPAPVARYDLEAR
jgi:hypothetical protein